MYDLEKLGLCEDRNCPTFSLKIAEYSKCFYGRYFPATRVVKIYRFTNEDKTIPYHYSAILRITIHEVCHHLQHTNPHFKRYRGVMHDAQFKKLYSTYTESAKKLLASRNERWQEKL